MAWYSHLFQNFPQFIVIHIIKGLGIVNKAEIDVFLELSCFFNDPADVGNLKNVINKVADGGRHCKENYGSANIVFFNRQKLTSIK